MAELPATLVKKNAKRVVWVYFGLTADEKGVPVPSEEHRPVCRTCKKAVMCKGGNTTNLFFETLIPSFTKRRYRVRRACLRGKSPRQLSLHSLPSSKREGSTTQKACQRRNSIAQPYSIVESPGFRALVRKLNPRYTSRCFCCKWCDVTELLR